MLYSRVAGWTAAGARHGIGGDIMAMVPFGSMRVGKGLSNRWQAQTERRCQPHQSKLDHYVPPYAVDTTYPCYA